MTERYKGYGIYTCWEDGMIKYYFFDSCAYTVVRDTLDEIKSIIDACHLGSN